MLRKKLEIFAARDWSVRELCKCNTYTGDHSTWIISVIGIKGGDDTTNIQVRNCEHSFE